MLKVDNIIPMWRIVIPNRVFLFVFRKVSSFGVLIRKTCFTDFELIVFFVYEFE